MGPDKFIHIVPDDTTAFCHIPVCHMPIRHMSQFAIRQARVLVVTRMHANIANLT